METLRNKVDFAVVFSVKGANPNGDPLNGNRPRTNYDNMGEVSDVCIKRKIRNRLMEAGHNIFVQSDDNRTDDYRSLRARAEGELKNISMYDDKQFRKAACKKWLDVRAFGQVFAYKGKGGDDAGVSIGIRGPVSIQSAFSVVPISSCISSIQITKSVSGEEDGTKKGPDTMGMKHRVDHGVYVSYGAINPQLASKTWFKDKDAAAIKNALEHLFDNDASSARPEGSMEVVAVLWWKHNCNNGQYSSAVVHRALSVSPKEGVTDPKKVEDYSIRLKNIPGLEPEIFNPNNIDIERIMSYAEDDLLQLSSLQHFVFCERQCALIHLEQLWSENVLTAEGRIMHDKVDTADRESRGNVRIEYGVPLRSLRLGLIGKADVVEFHRQGNKWIPFPVEYKRGKPKPDNCDAVQLCAQAICLEEMMGVEIPAGALFYGEMRRRHDVEFTVALRRETKYTAEGVRKLIVSGITPVAVYSAKCKMCSLVELCIPQISKRANNYLLKIIEGD